MSALGFSASEFHFTSFVPKEGQVLCILTLPVIFNSVFRKHIGLIDLYFRVGFRHFLHVNFI